MSDIIFTDKIKPITGKTIEIDGEIIVKKVQAENNTYESGAIIPLPSGIIMPFAGRNIPNGFLLCNGQELSREEYSSLFSAIGTDWGTGDGSTTFNIPDLRGAFIRGAGSHGTYNMANGNDFAGPSLGNFENDQVQGHIHNEQVSQGTDNLVTSIYGTGASANGNAAGYGAPTTSPRTETTTPVSDGTNGTPRTGDETRPFNAGVNYIIRI